VSDDVGFPGLDDEGAGVDEVFGFNNLEIEEDTKRRARRDIEGTSGMVE
jgi:hypothetical protein